MTTTLTPDRYLELITADGALLRSAAVRDLAAVVPSCPGWSAADLLTHVGEVYLHKVEAMRLGAPPDPWPPAEHADRAPLALFDEGLESVLGELRARGPGQPAWTFSPPDQTTGFWFRRMAQETAVHRYDAELAAGTPTPLEAELGVDGVDEILQVMLGGPWWADAPSEDAAGRSFQITCGDHSWLIAVERTVIEVRELDTGGGPPAPGAAATPGGAAGSTIDGLGEDGSAAGRVDAVISGSPSDVDLWLWGRLPDDRVHIWGDTDAIAGLRRRLADPTD